MGGKKLSGFLESRLKFILLISILIFAGSFVSAATGLYCCESIDSPVYDGYCTGVDPGCSLPPQDSPANCNNYKIPGTCTWISDFCWQYDGGTSTDIDCDTGIRLGECEELRNTVLYYPDDDGDGYGGSPGTYGTCSGSPFQFPSGYITTGGDCNDADANIYPGALELCDGVDSDCDGVLDGSEGFTISRSCGSDVGLCQSGTESGVCNNNGDWVYSGNCVGDIGPVTEVCDGENNDCDGSTDEGCDDDNDNYCDSGMTVVGAPPTCTAGGGDCNDNAAWQNPATDWWQDADGDKYWGATVSNQCAYPSGSGWQTSTSGLTAGGDCKDADANINPGATEVCDGVDNNCINGIDEGGVCLTPNGYWSLDGITLIIPTPSPSNLFSIDSFPFNIKLVVEDSGLASGTSVTFKVFERDTGLDDNINSNVPGSVDASGKAVATWTITEAQLDNAFGWLGEETSLYDPFEFYFELPGVSYPEAILYSRVDTAAIPIDYWASLSGDQLPLTSDLIGDRLVLCSLPLDVGLVVEYSTLSEGSTTFEVWEKDSGGSEEINLSVPGTVDDAEKAVATWTITQTDIDNSFADDGDGDYEFYFKLPGITDESPILYTEVNSAFGVDILSCLKYPSEISCNLDTCNVLANTASLLEVVCDSEADCRCAWNLNANLCMFESSPSDPPPCDPAEPDCWWEDDGDGIFTTGTCLYSENLPGEPDNCDDGYLTYSLTRTWSWSSENSLSQDPEESGYVEDPTGTWRYDPTGRASQCQGTYDQVIECPVEIQLPFFEDYGIFATALLIIIIYLFLSFKKKRKN